MLCYLSSKKDLYLQSIGTTKLCVYLVVSKKDMTSKLKMESPIVLNCCAMSNVQDNVYLVIFASGLSLCYYRKPCIFFRS